MSTGVILGGLGTILGGLALLVLGQIIIRSFIDPIYELRKMRGDIVDGLLFYSPFYMNPNHPHKTPEIDGAGDALRSLAARLDARRYAIPHYNFFGLIGAVPMNTSIDEARAALFNLSSSIYVGDRTQNETSRKKIVKALNLRISFDNGKKRSHEPDF